MEKLIKKNNQLIYIALLLFILLVFSAIGNSFKKDIIVELFGQKIENTKSKNIFVEKSEAYISLEALKKYIDAGAYYDKISKTCTITSGSQILKMELGASEASLNYEKIKVNQAVIRKGNEIYIPFSSIEKIYKIEGLISKNKKNVYIASSNIEQITLKNSNVNVYTKADIRNISKDKLNKKDKVFAYYTSTSSDWVLIKSEKEVVGYIGKYNLSQDSIKNIDLKTKELENKELSEKESAKTLKLNGVVSTLDYKVSSVYKENNIKNVFVNMFEVLKTNGELDSVPIASVALNILKNSGNKVYGNISNAYNSSNFDNTVIPNVIKNQAQIIDTKITKTHAQKILTKSSKFHILILSK